MVHSPLPLSGSGDKYGESVSTNILLFGIDLNVLANSLLFLNVITPLARKITIDI